MLRKALLILSGNAASSLLSLARNLIVARAVPVADYGIAATFALALAVIEMISAFGLQQQIVQARDGDEPRFQAALQGFQVLRGLVSGLALLLLAGSIADFMNIPEAAWAFRLLALVPVLNAFGHFDLHRLSRQMRFGPMLVAGILPPLLALVAVWPLLELFGDYRVMLVSILLQAGTGVVVSHVVAERCYRLRLDRDVIGRSIAFGWPLMINNVLLFGVFNGDRLIVGRVLGVEALAIFSMGVTLTLTPTLVLARSLQNLFLPKLSAVQDDPTRFPPLAATVMQAGLAVSVLTVVVVAMIGQPLVYSLLGAKYAPLLPLLTWFAIIQAIRVAKAGPSLIALAQGETTNAMYANAVRLAALPAAWITAVMTGEVLLVIWIAIAGEIAGLSVALIVLKLRSQTWPPHTAQALAATFLVIFSVVIGTLAQSLENWERVVLTALPVFGAGWAMPELRRQIAKQVFRRSA